MKQIIKGNEPPDLLKYRLTKDLNVSYDNFRPKDSLKECLLKEQGYICAFCMQRISEPKMEIAHWEPIKVKPERQLDYKNHLASCAGNRGNGPLHCNANQEDTLLKVNPADFEKNCESQIKYNSNGKIFSDDKDINKDLDITLNLNLETLQKNRKNAFKTVINQLCRLSPNKDFPENEIAKKIKQWKSKDANGYYNEYCQFVIYMLSKRL